MRPASSLPVILRNPEGFGVTKNPVPGGCGFLAALRMTANKRGWEMR